MGRSPATERAYVAAVRRFAKVSGSYELTEDAARRYIDTRRASVCQASINIELSALRAWHGWMELAAPESWKPVQLPRHRRPQRRVVRALADLEVGMLLAAPDLTTFVGLRDHVIMATLYQCGLRASEVARMELGSIRPDGLLVVHGKGGKYRLVPFGDRWFGLVSAYINQRAALRAGKKSALFLTQHGRPLRDGRSIWVIVNRYAQRALGLSCGFTRLEKYAVARPWQGHYPHLLRAAFATELHRNGCNLMALADMLGHASVETTTYYLGTDLGQLREAAAKHPRALRVHIPSPG